jgi:hypothetical protein
MSLPAAYSRILSGQGISMMEAFHTEDIALTADDAIAAAQTLVGERVAVIGGDVFYKTANGFELACATWYCKPAVGETVDAFVTRSVQETCDYVRRFPAVAGKTALFALVVTQVF